MNNIGNVLERFYEQQIFLTTMFWSRQNFEKETIESDSHRLANI